MKIKNAHKTNKTSPSFTHSNIGKEVPFLEEHYFFCDWIRVTILIKDQDINYGTISYCSNKDEDKVFDKRNKHQSVTIPNGIKDRLVSVSLKSFKYNDLYEGMLMANQNNTTNSSRKSIVEMLIEKFGIEVISKNGDEFVGIEISGNPTTFFQEHNVWGSSNISGILVDYITGVLKGVNLWDRMTKSEIKKVNSLNVVISELHIATNIKAENKMEKERIMNALMQQSTSSKGTNYSYLTTVSFGKKGHNQLVMYDKEIETKSKLKNSSLLDEIYPLTDGLIRCEIKLGRKWISQNKIRTVKDLLNFIGYDEDNSKLSIDNILNFFIARFKNVKFGQTALNIKEQEKKSGIIVDAIKNKHNFAKPGYSPRYCGHNHHMMYRLWMHGDSINNFMSKTSRYRIVRDIEELIGINILSPCVTGESNIKTESVENLILDRMVFPSHEWEIYHP